ncbi:MAG TPA: mannose-1-phosphate guanylyltransferase [Bryobacterales bacterium]|nr:mannose-1-phosphate guanylyltransferase [Bryobacterales bacterium]
MTRQPTASKQPHQARGRGPADGGGAGSRALPHFWALILAGGRGTRFWPRSRKARAKQVLPVLGKQSLIQQTYERLRPLVPPARFLIITNIYLREEIVRQLPQIPPEQVIAEPAQRNTAPCIGLAARILLERDPDAVMGVFPADHVIAREAAFRSVLRRAARAAQQDRLVVLGIEPRWPETGYGYIEFASAAGPHGRAPQRATPLPVTRFREKPDLATAKRFLRRGNFYWNSGMFVWKAAVINRALEQFLPPTGAALQRIRGRPGEARFARTLAAQYPLCENISIDYAVLEKAPGITGFPCGDLGWNDVGSWKAVYELLPHDRDGNVARSEALFHKATGSYVDAPGKLVAVVGIDDVIVVESGDALLVVPRDRAQEVGAVVKILERRGREDLL